MGERGEYGIQWTGLWVLHHRRSRNATSPHNSPLQHAVSSSSQAKAQAAIASSGIAEVVSRW